MTPPDLALILALLQDIEAAHRTPIDGFQYNGCDATPCAWCVSARGMIAALKGQP